MRRRSVIPAAAIAVGAVVLLVATVRAGMPAAGLGDVESLQVVVGAGLVGIGATAAVARWARRRRVLGRALAATAGAGVALVVLGQVLIRSDARGTGSAAYVPLDGGPPPIEWVPILWFVVEPTLVLLGVTLLLSTAIAAAAAGFRLLRRRSAT